MRFSLRQLEAFLAVASEGSVSGAAAKLGVSQVAVSGLLASLEAAVTVTLLERRRGAKAVCTHDGTALAPLARAVLAAAADLEAAATRLSANHMVRNYRIAGRPFVVDSWLQAMLTQFQVENPGHSVTLLRATNNEIFAGLANRELAVGVFMAQGELPALPCRRIGTRAAGLYVSPNHPLAFKKNPTVEDLKEQGFIYPPAGSPIEQSVNARLQHAGIGPVRVVARTEFADAIRMMTVSGVGIGLLFDMDSQEQIRNGQIVRLDIAIDPVEFLIATPQDPDEISMMIAHFLEAQLSKVMDTPIGQPAVGRAG